MNRITFVARLTGDPVENVIQTQNGTMKIVRFSTAENFRFGDKEEAIFRNCSAVGNTAEFLAKYVHKGTKLVLFGSERPNNYTDKDGVARTGTEYRIDQCEFAESKPAQQTAPQQTASQQGMVQQTAPQQGMPQQAVPQQGMPPMNMPPINVPPMNTGFPGAAAPQNNMYAGVAASQPAAPSMNANMMSAGATGYDFDLPFN